MSALNEFDLRALLAAKFTLREISNHEQKFYNLFHVAPMLSADIERMDALTKEHRTLKAQRDELLSALNAMMTHMGMDEDEWNKPTFDQARAAIAKATGGTA